MIGEQFAKVKENLKSLRNGNGWREWCENRAKISHVTAFNYINAFENRESVKNFNTFGKSALFLLVAPNTPQEVRNQIHARCFKSVMRAGFGNSQQIGHA